MNRLKMFKCTGICKRFMKLTFWKNKFGLKQAIWQTLLLIEKHLRQDQEMNLLQIYKYKSQNLRLELADSQASSPFDPNSVHNLFFFSSIPKKDYSFNDFYDINLDFDRGLHLFKEVHLNSDSRLGCWVLIMFLVIFFWN